MVNRIWNLTVINTLLLLLLTTTSPVLSQEPFYKDKTIRILVGASPGGIFDSYSRILARHLTKHIAGNPTFVVENVPGAGGLIVANRLYKAVKPDGLTIGHFNGGLVLGQVVGNAGIEFDAPKFQWIGVPTKVYTTCVFTKASGITSIQRWMSNPRPVKLGATGPGSNMYDVPRVLGSALQLQFQLVAGYKGAAEIKLAAEAGELDGVCWGWDTTSVVWANAVEVGEIIPVLQAAPRALPGLTSVPLAIDLAKGSDPRRLVEVGIHDQGAIVLSHALPPGTPKEPLQIMRQAFTNVLKDPELLAESKKARLTIDPVSGEELEKIMSGLLRLESGFVGKLKTIFVVKN